MSSSKTIFVRFVAPYGIDVKEEVKKYADNCESVGSSVAELHIPNGTISWEFDIEEVMYSCSLYNGDYDYVLLAFNGIETEFSNRLYREFSRKAVSQVVTSYVIMSDGIDYLARFARDTDKLSEDFKRKALIRNLSYARSRNPERM